MRSSDVEAAARAYLDVKWVHQGRARVGIDCAGLLIRVHLDLGLPVEDMRGYKRTPDGPAFLDHIRRQTLYTRDIKPGTVAIFKESLFPCHVGFFSEKHGVTHIIHSYAPAGKVVEEPFEHFWPSLHAETRELIGIEY